MVGSDDFDMVDGKMKQSTTLKICFLVCLVLFSNFFELLFLSFWGDPS